MKEAERERGEDEAMKTEDRDNQPEREDAGPQTVLIVEDDGASRTVLTDFVTTMGHQPLPAGTGGAGLELMTKHDPDMLLLDIMLPDMDGYEILERAKSDERLRHVPVIMISAIDEMDSVALCIERGADDYLVKPFNPVLLRARVRACLEKKALHDREQGLYRDLESSYERLRQAEAARDTLSHMIVHDLCTPLSNVLGYTELMLEGIAQGDCDTEVMGRDLNRIRDSAESMLLLTRGILDVAKLESGEMRASLTRVDVSQLARAVCEGFGGQAESQSVSLELAGETESVYVRADEDLLSRVLQNLISNALKHSERVTQVTVTVSVEAKQAVLCVADDGRGIPEADRERIFEKFFQAEARQEGKKYGVGLGLAFCRMAVEAHGGRIWVESGPDKGSRFFVAIDRWEGA